MKTWYAKENEVERKWWIVDATDKRLGRIATHIANKVRVKDKAIFTPHADTGDFVIVVNASKIQLTGDKLRQKKYYRHSRFFGSLKEKSAAELVNENPSFLVREAVRGMLPTNKLSRDILSKLKTYDGPDHPHAAQKPEALTLD